MVTWVALGAGGGRVWAGEADALINKGVQERRLGHDDRALELFKRAHEIEPGARSEAQMGLAEQALGMWADAEKHIKAALAQGDDPWIKKNRATISRALDVVMSHLGSLDVRGTPAGAEVLIGKHRAGELPLGAPLRIQAGTVAVTVRAPGFVDVSRVIDVPAGRNVREQFELTPKAALTSLVSREPDPEPAKARSPEPKLMVARDAEAEEPAPASHPVWKRWWFWALVGAVAVGGATAVLLARQRSDCEPGSMCSSISSGN